MRYSGKYRFAPHTLSDDGDLIDVLIANTRPIFPGAMISRSARPSRSTSIMVEGAML